MSRQDYTVKELAALAKVDPSRIRQLLGDGTLKGIKRAGVWFIPVADAKAWLELRK